MISKIKISAVALFGAMVSGCITDGPVNEPRPDNPPKIVFGVSVATQTPAATTRTRGAVSITRGVPVRGTSIPDGASIGVYPFILRPANDAVPGTIADAAPYSVPGMTANTSVTRSGADPLTADYIYNSGTPVEWPADKNAHMMFVGYHPYMPDSQLATGTSAGVHSRTAAFAADRLLFTLEYFQNPDPAGHVDLMAGITSRTLYHTPTVPVSLEHLLQRITFEARLDDVFYESLTVSVTRVSLKNVTRDGTYTAETAPYSGNGPFTFAGVWSTNTVDEIDIVASSAATGLNENAFLSRTGYTSLLSATGDMMVIPQALDDVTIEVDLKITDSLGDYYKTYAVSLADTQAWRPNGYINYRFLIPALSR